MQGDYSRITALDIAFLVR